MIPFNDLKAQYESIKTEIDAAIKTIVDSQALVGGSALTDFESDFSKYCKTSHSIGVGNGTDAIQLALNALGVGPGDEVITVTNTFIATTEAITAVGASIKFVDVMEETALMDISKLSGAITTKTKCIIPVHLYGQMVNTKAIKDLLLTINRPDIKLLEDSAQAHGADYDGDMPGTHSDCATFSFYPGKNLGAFGDGGAISTNDQAFATQISMARNHGRTKKYEHDFEGRNSRLDALQAAILSVKLKHLPKWLDARRHLASRYDEHLTGTGIILLKTDPKATHTYHLYVICVENRDDLMSKLKAKNISSGIHYPIPLHLQPAYSYLGLKTGDFPVSERLASDCVSLPIYPEMKTEQQDVVIASIKEILN